MTRPFPRRFALSLSVALAAGTFGCAERESDPIGPTAPTPAPAGSEDDAQPRIPPSWQAGSGSGADGYLDPRIVPGQCAVKIAADETEASVNEKYGTRTLLHIEGSEFVILAYPAGWDVWALCARMISEGDCSVAEPVFRTEAPEANQGTLPFYEGGHDSTSVAGQDAFARIGAPAALAVSRGAGILVAVLDTGVDATHPDFGSSIAANGYDFLDDDADPSDLEDAIDQDRDGFVDEGAGHGTHIAGIIHALAPDAQILPIRVLDSDGIGTTVAVARGIRYAIQSGARAINLSFGLHATPELLKEAIRLARYQGVLVVASAGNEARLEPYYFPARWSDVMAVASTTVEDERAPFTNYGSHISVCAPGEDILAPGLAHGYAYWTGTSMSAPMVVAAAALRLQIDPWLHLTELTQSIESSSFPVEFDGDPRGGLMGAGRLDLESLVND